MVKGKVESEEGRGKSEEGKVKSGARSVKRKCYALLAILRAEGSMPLRGNLREEAHAEGTGEEEEGN